MIHRWNGFRWPPHTYKVDIAIVILLCLVLISCGYSMKPHQTKIKYETESNTTDKTSSDKDTIKSGKTWGIEQIFRWEEK